MRLQATDDRIRSDCSDCDDNGFISGWRETAWDYSWAASEEP